MEVLSRNQEKFIRSLQQKKFRKQEALFVVEGEKMVQEALNSDFKIHSIVLDKNKTELQKVISEAYLTDEMGMKRMSTFKTPPGILAVLETKEDRQIMDDPIVLVLEKIQDPGNLGTIIRTADAFGIQTIVCSEDTVEHLSPKVLQATMGSIFRVNLHYVNLHNYLEERRKHSTLYAAHLNGSNVYDVSLQKPATLIMGNESKGISEESMQMVENSIKIPIPGNVESFNVSIATAILLAEFNRQFSSS